MAATKLLANTLKSKSPVAVFFFHQVAQLASLVRVGSSAFLCSHLGRSSRGVCGWVGRWVKFVWLENIHWRTERHALVCRFVVGSRCESAQCFCMCACVLWCLHTPLTLLSSPPLAPLPSCSSPCWPHPVRVEFSSLRWNFLMTIPCHRHRCSSSQIFGIQMVSTLLSAVRVCVCFVSEGEWLSSEWLVFLCDLPVGFFFVACANSCFFFFCSLQGKRRRVYFYFTSSRYSAASITTQPSNSSTNNNNNNEQKPQPLAFHTAKAYHDTNTQNNFS